MTRVFSSLNHRSPSGVLRSDSMAVMTFIMPRPSRFSLEPPPLIRLFACDFFSFSVSRILITTNCLRIAGATRYEGGLFQCMNAWMITWAKVHERGWGPLLYDLAMEYATIKGTGLMSDRQTVSDDAKNVWDYYMANRGNVERVQMDDWDDNLTPGDESDNCDQGIAYEKGLPGGTFWDPDNEETPWDPYGKEVLLKSPISKMYRWKGMSKIAALKKMDRWMVK